MNTSVPFSNARTHLLNGVLTFFIIILSLQAQAMVRYVKPTASGTGDGTTWANASGNLQAMINASGSGDEVWVAAGTYKPTSGTDRSISFSMKNGVAIYGGFNGMETQLSQRNWRTNVTTLSGDIGISGNNSDNSYSVIVNEGISSAIFDGFTVTQANTAPPTGNLNGGGIYNAGSSPTIRNCIFSNNTGSYGNAGIFNFNDATPTIINCLFINNVGTVYSSGVFNFGGSANIINCTFYGNHTAIINQAGNLVSVSNCILWGNNNSFNIIAPPTTAFTVANSIVQGGWSGTGNLNADPLFVNTAGGDFRLQGCSPAINTGGNGYVPGGITTDLDGNPRFYNNGTVDMGAYEFQSTPPTFVTCYRDSDNDSFGNPAMSQVFCNTCGTGYVSNGADCNDANQAINPFAAEVCDGFDNNCNSQTDEGNVCCPPGNVIYVKANATGANNGTSWINAYTNLQSALNSACPGIAEIWVAAGTYKPTTTNDRNISFVMKNGVAIYGGFNGTETQLSQRNWVTNVTTLSGDIGAAGNADNTYRVINNNFNANAPLTSSAILDGFTVEAGNADGNFPLNLGGGMWNSHASPTVRNCIFRNNRATSGAAMFNDNSQANVINCLFTGNSCSVAGAAISNGGGTASAKVINCTFYGNTGGNSTISNEVNATAVSNCIVWGNANGVSGGTVTYSIVQGGFTGTGNLNADPLFVNAAGGDFNFQDCSPAINAGSNAAAPADLSTDLNRNPRFFNSGIVDMGAYEYQDTPNLCLCSNQRTWTGNAGSDWDTDANWNPACVPTANDHAIIPFATNAPVIQAGTAAAAKSVHVQTGGSLTIAATGSLSINGFFNYGSFITSGFRNEGTVANSGQLLIGATGIVGNFGLYNEATFQNNSGGEISIDQTTDRGIWNRTGTFTNAAKITIGANNSVGNLGIHSNTTFDNQSGGEINIDRSSSKGLYNESGTFTNAAKINIGAIAGVGFDGLVNEAIFQNNSGGEINIDRSGSVGLANYAGTFTNAAKITIGANNSVGNEGLWNSATFQNNNGGEINIDRSADKGLYNRTGVFTNTAKITIGANHSVGSFGIYNNAAFNNQSGGEINIDRSSNRGLWNLTGTFTNAAKITIGAIANVGFDGLVNDAIFQNNSGGEINIDRSGSVGLANYAGTFTNAAKITIGANNSVGNEGLWNSATFQNNACAEIRQYARLFNNNTFTNGGLMLVSTASAHNSTALTNNGIIAYPQGNPIANVTNNEIIIAPTTANNCDAISPAFGLSSPVDFTIMGIFSDEAGALSAGTYTTATNTFTPAAVLAEGAYTFYVKITDGNCTRIIPWQLTAQNCCDAPQAICKTAVITLVGAGAGLAVDDVNNGSSADCGLQSIGVSPNMFNCSHVGAPQTVTLTIMDIKGATASCQTTVTVQDNTPPSITCPTTQTLALGANCSATLPDYTSLATAADNCGVQSVSQSPVAGTSVSGAGNMTVTLTVTDINGLTNTCTFTVTNVDNTAPSITCPTTQTLALGANCSATLPDYTSLATTGDNCGVQSVSQSPTTGTTVSGAGNMSVTLTVTDINGLTNTCTFTVTKVDNTPPSITCPTTQTLALGANCSATLPDYTSLATTADNCGVQSVSQSPVAGTSVSGAGNISVTLTVTDVNGLTNTCSFTVTKIDNTVPTIACPANQNLALGSSCSAALPSYISLATASDNCGVQSVMQSPVAGTSVSGAGNMSVTLTVTDVNGLTNTCSFTVSKVDNTPPGISCVNTTATFNGDSSLNVNPASLATAFDNCGSPTLSVSAPMLSCAQVGQTVPVTVTATDAAGLTASCISQVTVQGLPCGWSRQPDGIGCTDGSSVSYNSGVFTLNSTNCYYAPPFTADEAAFAQHDLCGNGSIQAQVTSINGGGWAGIVMREGNAPGARKVQLMTNLGSLSRREVRYTTGGQAYPQQFPSQNRYWLRILRQGSQFVGYISANGSSWSQVFALTVSMANCIEVGLVVTNNNPTGSTSATFSNVSVIGNANLIAIEVPDPGAETANLNLFPNPTTGEVSVDLAPWAGRPVVIDVYDLQGRRVYRREVDEAAGIEPVDISQLPGGVYLFKVGGAQQRVILQR